MDLQNKVKIKDLPPDLHAQIVAALNHSMVCIGHANRKQSLVAPRGSGTLVRSGETYGILTAAHVLDAVENEDEVCIFPNGGRGLFVFNKDATLLQKCPNAKFDQSGPDIGFLRIPNAMVGAIKAQKSFINLDRQAEMRKTPLDTDIGVWCTTGFPGLLGQQYQDGEKLHTKLFGLVGLGIVDNYETRDNFDYYSIGVEFANTTDLPESFAGMSGGGLWQVALIENNGAFTLGDSYLSGVLFFQTAMENSFRSIVCHGHKSIYNYVLPEMINQPK